MTNQKERVIWLTIGLLAYGIAWAILAGLYPGLNQETPQLLMSAPFMWLMMLLIVEAGKYEETL